MVPTPRFDALIVFGYGPVQPGAAYGAGKLNVYGRLNALAAGMLFSAGEVGAMIPTGGRTGGDHLPSEAALIARLLHTRFAVPEVRILREEQSTDTLTNLAHVANLSDARSDPWSRLGFVAVGLHLPRIREICALVGLDGTFIAAEDVVRGRSARHERLLGEILQPSNESYSRMQEDQARGLRGLHQMPAYWLPPMAVIESPVRLRKILQAERIETFLQQCGMDVGSATHGQLRAWLGSLQREFPS